MQTHLGALAPGREHLHKGNVCLACKQMGERQGAFFSIALSSK